MHNWEFGMGFGWIIPLLFVVAIFYLLNTKSEANESAQDILNKKYAKGEIDEEEYKRKKEQLKH